jgi:hypothetical protein
VPPRRGLGNHTNQEIPNEAPIRDVPSRIKPRLTSDSRPTFLRSTTTTTHNGQSICSCLLYTGAHHPSLSLQVKVGING